MANELPRHTEAIEPIRARMGIQGDDVMEVEEAGAAEDMGGAADATLQHSRTPPRKRCVLGGAGAAFSRNEIGG
ncbi:hypothetical protein SAMD00023378_1030 [Ralstonia sp. NT80]|nr:hypothetical protein SAMD00023378_1030 [Ralstonia sp. NT80]